MSDNELPPPRLRVGGWLPPQPRPPHSGAPTGRPPGSRSGAHRIGAPRIGAPRIGAARGDPSSPGPTYAFDPGPDVRGGPRRPWSRRLVAAGAVAAVFSVAGVLAVTRVGGPTGVERVTAEPPAPTPLTALSAADRAVAPSGTPPAGRPATTAAGRTTTPGGAGPGGRGVPATPRRPPHRTGTPAATRAAGPPVTGNPASAGTRAPVSGSPVTGTPVTRPQAGRSPAVPLTAGATVSLVSATHPDRRIRHDGDRARVDPIGPGDSAADKAEATFVVRGGLADGGCVSFESVDEPGSFLRHQNYAVVLHEADGGRLFALDATFCPVPGLDGGTSLRSKNYPDRHLTERDSLLFLDVAAAATRATTFTPRPAP